MMSEKEKCPVCGSADIRDVGRVFHPEPPRVAGVAIDLTGLDFHLLACGSGRGGCGFQFKRPFIPTEKLLACYAQADTGNWGVDPDPIQRRFDTLLAVVRRHAPVKTGGKLRVLDVGCFNGAMLKYFGDEFDRYGVEPGKEPAAMAGTRGVQMLADTIEQVEGHEDYFDVILSIDVLEHINDPIAFFQKVSRLLKPGGIFIGMTGDTDAPSFRLQGSLYWYVSKLPEHVSFWNKSSMSAVGERCGMKLVDHMRMSHARNPASAWIVQTGMNLAFAALRPTGGLGVPALRKRVSKRSAPNWIASADHLIDVLRKN